MALGVELDQLLAWLGHDGSDIIWPDKPEPHNRRSFHIQEMVRYCIALDVAAIRIECIPMSVSYGSAASILNELGEAIFATSPDMKAIQEQWLKLNGSVAKLEDQSSWIEACLASHDAVLLGVTAKGTKHAVAWDHRFRLIKDPNGTSYPIGEFGFYEVYLIK